MGRIRLKLSVFALLCMVILNGFTISGAITQPTIENKRNAPSHFGTDFYFIQLTDTHVMSKLFDRDEISTKRLRSALDYFCSFEKKPAFIVITGDLTNWGGAWISGALNCRAFVSCFHKKDSRLYADTNFSIPVYTTPGNHEYIYARNLNNYYHFIENEDRYIVKYNGTSLFFMDSGPFYFDGGAGLYDADMAWLESAFENCTSHLKIVLMHHPAVNQRIATGRMVGVIVRNREAFVSACESNQVELVLAGHTHRSMVYDGNESVYNVTTSLNCRLYPTLFVQTDDSAQVPHYRNVSVIGDDVWLGSCVEVPVLR